MEILILLAVLYAVFNGAKKSGSKKKKKGIEAAPEVRRTRPAPAKKPEPAAVRMERAMERAAARREGQPEPGMADSAGCQGGSIPHRRHEGQPEPGMADSAGCQGGSIPHDKHEGQPVPMAAKQQEIPWGSLTGACQEAPRPARRPLAAQEAPSRRSGLGPKDMSAAVVMAEILDRPVSLRGRGPRGRRTW